MTTTQQPTDTELKQILAKMLPKRLEMRNTPAYPSSTMSYEIQNKILVYKDGLYSTPVLDSELLSFCWEVEDNLWPDQIESYDKLLVEIVLDYWKSQGKSINEFTPQMVRYACTHASWQQRIMALGKLKGVLV